jgi:ABC-type multidrug transport system ATPase subunit
MLRLRDGDPARYQGIVRTVKQVAPFFREFVLEPELAADRVRLRWQQEGSDTVLPADALSDGTLRFICLAALLGQAELPGLIILDEPELGLHPFAIVQLAGMLRTASQGSQVLLATQSVTLMNQFELDDLIVVERRKGSSVFDRPDPGRLSEWHARSRRSRCAPGRDDHHDAVLRHPGREQRGRHRPRWHDHASDDTVRDVRLRPRGPAPAAAAPSRRDGTRGEPRPLTAGLACYGWGNSRNAAKSLAASYSVAGGATPKCPP